VKKIKSLLTEKEKSRQIRAKYEEIYSDSETWLYEKSHGVHSVVLSQIKQELAGKKYLDVGCGAGRLALMCAHFADQVTAIDFSEKAIFLASLNASCLGLNNIELQGISIEEFCNTQAEIYDVVTMIGVLEHVENPLGTLQAVNTLLPDQGILVVSCPNFINFRGFTYMTLLTLFDLPMSLADLRQIDYQDISAWAASSGFKLLKTVGAIYQFGWGEKAYKDMVRRVPLAIKDKKKQLDPDHDRYNTWLRRMLDCNAQYVEWLEDNGIIKRIERQVELKMERKVAIVDSLWEKLSRYIQEDITSDPYYTDMAPFCYMGGEAIYILKKVSGNL
jgi:ubiquinone biosynthesis O-methyltransferase